MELLAKPFSGGALKRYWRRRQYQRLSAGKGIKRKNVRVTRIRGGSRRFWKIKAIPKLRWKIASPIKLLAKLKNAYMNMMISLAGNVGSLNTENTFGGKRVPKARQATLVYSINEFDQRLIYEISKALVATRELSVK